MESLTFLKYWKSGGTATTAITPAGGANPPVSRTSATATLLTSSVSGDSEPDDCVGADSDFINLELAGNKYKYSSVHGDDAPPRTVPDSAPGELMDDPDHDDDVEDDVSSEVLTGEAISKHQLQGFPLSTKLRVLMMSGLKKPKTKRKPKPKPNSQSADDPPPTTMKQQQQQQQNDAAGGQNEMENNNNKKKKKKKKQYFKVEELVSIVSMFTTRDDQTGSRSNSKKYHSDKLIRFSGRIFVPSSSSSSSSTTTSCPEPKPNCQPPPQRSSVKKSLKPAAVRPSAKEGESMRREEVEDPGKEDHGGVFAGKLQQQGNNLAAMGLKVLVMRRRYLGKSRSASSAVSSSSPPVMAPNGMVRSQRRDDSLLQQQDGIESAILHCKKSFNAGRHSSGGDAGEGGETGTSSSMLLSRSVSDPLYEKSMKVAAAAVDEMRRAPADRNTGKGTSL